MNDSSGLQSKNMYDTVCQLGYLYMDIKQNPINSMSYAFVNVIIDDQVR